MTIHEPGHPTHGWRCTQPGCNATGCGYPSESAAIRAEKRHAERANHTTPARSAA